MNGGRQAEVRVQPLCRRFGQFLYASHQTARQGETFRFMAGCTARRQYVIPVLYGGSGIAVRRWENDANDWDAAVFYGGIFTVFCVSLYCRISFAILEDGFGNTG